MILVRPVRTASSAGLTISALSTNHWSVSIGSITTLERSPKGCMIALASTSGTISSPSSPSGRLPPRRSSAAVVMTARPASVMSATTALRASNRSMPRYFSGTRFSVSISISVASAPSAISRARATQVS